MLRKFRKTRLKRSRITDHLCYNLVHEGHQGAASPNFGKHASSREISPNQRLFTTTIWLKKEKLVHLPDLKKLVPNPEAVHRHAQRPAAVNRPPRGEKQPRVREKPQAGVVPRNLGRLGSRPPAKYPYPHFGRTSHLTGSWISAVCSWR